MNRVFDSIFVAEAQRLIALRVEQGIGLGPDGKTRAGATVCVTPTEVFRNVDLERGSHRDVEDALRAAGWKSLYVGNKRFFRPTGFAGTTLLTYAEAKLAKAEAAREARLSAIRAKRAGEVLA